MEEFKKLKDEIKHLKEKLKNKSEKLRKATELATQAFLHARKERDLNNKSADEAKNYYEHQRKTRRNGDQNNRN